MQWDVFRLRQTQEEISHRVEEERERKQTDETQPEFRWIESEHSNDIIPTNCTIFCIIR